MQTTQNTYYSSLCVDPDLHELVQLFIDELPSRLLQLQQALENCEYSELARFAHQLKGAGGSYGFPQLTPAAAHLEQLARLGADDAVLRGALDELVEVTGRLRAGLPD